MQVEHGDSEGERADKDVPVLDEEVEPEVVEKRADLLASVLQTIIFVRETVKES